MADGRLIWAARVAAGPLLKVHREPLALGPLLPEGERRIIEDHAGLNLAFPAVAEKRLHEAYLSHVIYRASDRDLLARHGRQIADALLSEGAVLEVDRRLVGPGAQPDRVEEPRAAQLYLPGVVPPEDLDLLYSELPLLDLKL